MAWTEIDGSSTAGVGALLPWVPTFNVKSAPYNATGNNTTDDATAINAALTAAAAAGGGVVFLPNATGYLIGTKLTIGSNVILRGEGYGSYLNLSALATGVEASSTNRTGIENLRIGGTSAQAIRFANTTQSWICGCWIAGATLNTAPAGERIAGIYGRANTDLLIEGNRLSGNGFGASNTVDSEDIMLDYGATRCRIVNNTAVSTAVTMNIIYECNAVAQTGQDVQIVGNVCSGAITATANDKWGYGIAVYGTGSFPVNTIIANNTVRTTGGPGIYNEASAYSVISGNTVTTACQTHDDTSLPAGGIAVNASQSGGTLVVGNTISASGKHGIVLNADQVEAVGNTVDAPAFNGISLRGDRNGVVISGNRVVGTLNDNAGIGSQNVTNGAIAVVVSGNTVVSAAGVGSGINFSKLNNSTVSGNTVYANGGYGIALTNPTRVAVTGNSVRDNGGGNAGVYSGIYIAGATSCRADGNISTGANQKAGIEQVGSGDSLSIINNDLSGNVAPISSNATARNRRGNRISAGQCEGSAVLVGGTVTVSTAEIVTGDRVLLTNVLVGGTQGMLSLGTIVNVTSFVINSSNGADTSTVFWEIVH